MANLEFKMVNGEFVVVNPLGFAREVANSAGMAIAADPVHRIRQLRSLLTPLEKGVTDVTESFIHLLQGKVDEVGLPDEVQSGNKVEAYTYPMCSPCGGVGCGGSPCSSSSGVPGTHVPGTHVPGTHVPGTHVPSTTSPTTKRPWNRQIWFAVPALRAEPFLEKSEAKIAIRKAKRFGLKQAKLYAFPSRNSARRLEGIENMPMEVVYNR